MKNLVKGVAWVVCLAACDPSRTGGNARDGTDLASGGADLAHPGDGGIFVDTATIYAHEAETLYTVDPVTFDLVRVGVFGAGDEMTDMAITPDGKIYTISRTSLYLVNPQTALATLVLASVNSTTNVALAFQTDGTLLAADKLGKVRRIDPVGGTVTELGMYGSGFDTAGDLVVVSDGTMFGIAEKGPGSTAASNVLLSVDASSGVASGIGPIGYSGVFGIAYSNGEVVAFTSDGKIITINRTTGQGTLRKAHDGKRFWGAGTSPLVPIG